MSGLNIATSTPQPESLEREGTPALTSGPFTFEPDTITSNAQNSAAMAGVTEQFKQVLEATRAAGFPDFDRMVSAYYTSSFEKGSVPYMAQRASRSRRLGNVLKDVHENSTQWPRWEARGFRDETVESAKSVCVEEIEKISRRLGRMPGGFEGQSNILARSTSLPEDIESAVQDEAPHLWSLLTELAGPQSLYCDRISHAVLALLANGRRNA